MQPEVEYGKIQIGPTYDRARHHPLLIPTTGDTYPHWSEEHFQGLAAQARNGQIVVLQFHGVPDREHPWVHTPPEMFRKYMAFLREAGYRVIALRDLESYLVRERLPDDPMLKVRFPEPI